MKKTLSVIALLLAAIMVMACFAACGDDKKSDDKDESSKSTASNSGDESKEDAADSLTGTYKLVGLEGSFTDEDKAQLDQIKDLYTLTIDENNAGAIYMEIMDGKLTKTDCTFDTQKNEVAITDQGSVPYTFDGKQLKITAKTEVEDAEDAAAEIIQVFEKTSDKAEAPEGEIIDLQSLADSMGGELGADDGDEYGDFGFEDSEDGAED